MTPSRLFKSVSVSFETATQTIASPILTGDLTLNTDIRITPRNLGSICLDGYCPRCFKYLLIQKFHPPFNHFGAAIFSDMQKSQEAVIGFYLDRDGCLPKEFSPFSDCSSRANFPRHWSKFSYTHESGVILYGAPDEIFHRKDGTLCVVDLKTAHCKKGKDPFRGQYEVQVVGYADIAEGLGSEKSLSGAFCTGRLNSSKCRTTHRLTTQVGCSDRPSRLRQWRSRLTTQPLHR